jgi:hypothetical protein
MKTPRFIITLFALTFAFAPQSFRTATAKPIALKYHAELISPRAGEVLVPGQVFRISWRSTLPLMDLSLCETELRLSLDGGRTFTWITGERDPTVKYLDWIVPNTPTNAAVLDVHFGCLGYYPETESLQVQSAFVIRALN